MGCCASKDADGSKPNERSPLLPSDGNSAYADTLHNRMSYQRYDAAANLAKERETLQKIVQRTAENLIDISNTHPTERLQQQDAIDRANEYKDLIATIKLKPQTLQRLQGKSSTLPRLNRNSSVRYLSNSSISSVVSEAASQPHILLSENPVTVDDLAWLSNAMNDIQEAVKHIEVQYVSDLVVPLTWNPPAPPVHPTH